MSEPIRPPTPDEKRQMSETAGELEKQVMAALQAWGSAVYSIGFAAGVERVMNPITKDGIFAPARPPLVIP